jgi:hypothetical protein
VEWLGGAQPLSEEAEKKLQRKAEARAREEERHRLREIEMARGIWESGAALGGSLAMAYFEARGIGFADGEAVHSLRYHAELPYWFNPPAAAPYVIHKGPAVIAAIVKGDALQAVHCTWLAEDGTAKLKMDGPDGLELKAKKVRGPMQGGAIRLTPPAPLLLIGEGIETTRTALMVMRAAGIDCAAWCGVAIGNICGASLGQGTPHPTKPGRRVPNWQPDPDRPGLMPPDWAEEIILLGDSDSDQLITQAMMSCAAARFHATGRRVRIAWADAGQDFNDMVRA